MRTDLLEPNAYAPINIRNNGADVRPGLMAEIEIALKHLSELREEVDALSELLGPLRVPDFSNGKLERARDLAPQQPEPEPSMAINQVQLIRTAIALLTERISGIRRSILL